MVAKMVVMVVMVMVMAMVMVVMVMVATTCLEQECGDGGEDGVRGGRGERLSQG